jgi:cytochrome P450
MFDASFYADPYPMYDKLRSLSPVLRAGNVMGPLPAWLVTGHAEARQVLTHPGISKDVRRFQHIFDAAGMPDTRNAAVTGTMVATDPPGHTRLRKLAAKAFPPNTSERLRPRIEQITVSLIDQMQPHGRADLIEAFAAPLPVTVISELLGVPEPDRDNLRTWSAASFNEEDPATRQTATHNLAGYMATLIAAKRADPGDDLLT